MSRLSDDVLGQLRGMAEEISQQEGCVLYDLQFAGGPGQRILRVFIDRTEGVVSVDDCAKVSRGLNLLLDVRDLIGGGSYDLEVSSPGLERHLVETWHFEKAVGQEVKISTSEPLEVPEGVLRKPGKGGPMAVEGLLIGASEENLVVENDKAKWKVPRGIIRAARVKFSFGEKSAGKKKTMKRKKR